MVGVPLQGGQDTGREVDYGINHRGQDDPVVVGQADYNIGIDCGKSGLVVIDDKTRSVSVKRARRGSNPRPSA